jgi:hypothetical protein
MSIRERLQRLRSMRNDMKYLCLVYLEQDKLHAVPDRECQACGDSFRKSGLLVAAEALEAIETATTVRVRNGKMSITDGPFAETKELVGGFWVWQVKSLDEAIEWVKRCPNPHTGESEIEVRQVFEPEDFAPAFSEEDIQQEKNIRAQLADQAAKQ